jgi:phage shock protein A
MQGLEAQVATLDSSLAASRSETSALSLELTKAQHELECLKAEHEQLAGAWCANVCWLAG